MEPFDEPAADEPAADEPADESTPPSSQQLEFVAEKSKHYLQQQDEIIRHRRQNAGVFVTLLTALLTFFFSQTISPSWGRFLVLLPLLGTALYTFWLFFGVLLEKQAASGLNPTEFGRVINESYEKVLLLEIAANQLALTFNGKEMQKSYAAYNRAVRWSSITVFLTLISCLLLKFVFPPPDSPPQQVVVTCQQFLEKKPLRSTKNTGSQSLSLAASSASEKDSLLPVMMNRVIIPRPATNPKKETTDKAVRLP